MISFSPTVWPLVELSKDRISSLALALLSQRDPGNNVHWRHSFWVLARDFKYLFDLELLSFGLNIVWKFQLNLLLSPLLKQICLWITSNKSGKQRRIQKPCFTFQSNSPWWGSSLDFSLNPRLQAQREHAPRNVLSQRAFLQGHTLWGISHS